MASISQLYRSLTSDGRFDRRDAAQLLDEAARDGVRDADEDRELRAVASALQRDSLAFEPGASRDFTRFANLRDGALFVQARAAAADGRVDDAELEGLLAGPVTRERLEDLRALLDASELSPQARARVLAALPNVRRPWERPELVLRGPDPYPGPARGDLDDGAAEVRVPLADGSTVALQREFADDGRVLRVTVDREGDGVVDQTHEYLYDDARRLVGSRSYRGTDAATADLLVETRATLDAAGRVIAEDRAVTVDGQVHRERASHARDPLTGEDVVELSGDARVLDRAATLYADGEPGTTTVVAERVKLSREGAPRSHVVELDSADPVSADVGWHTDVHPPDLVLNQGMHTLTRGVEERDARGRVTARETASQRAEFDLDAEGRVTAQRFFVRERDGELRLVTSWKMERDDRGRVVSEERETRRKRDLPLERSRATHTWGDDGSEAIEVEAATGSRSVRRAAHGGVTDEVLRRPDGSVQATLTARYDASGRLLGRDETQRDEHGLELEHLHEAQQWGDRGVVARETTRSSTGLSITERFADDARELVLERELTERTVPRLSRFDRGADAGDFGADPRPVLAESRRHERFTRDADGVLVTSSARWEERYVRGEA